VSVFSLPPAVRRALSPNTPVWIAAAILLCLALSVFLTIHAHRENGVNGFPLDDAWIHLTFARNLHTHHAFAYWPSDKPTAGSTSPLYTFLLAAGFAFTRNEKLLSYVLGVACHALFLIALALWARRRLGSALSAAAVVLLLGLDARISVLSVAGMETPLFLALVAAAFYLHLAGRWIALGIVLGLSVWTRPDGLILAAVLLTDGVLDRLTAGSRRVGKSERRSESPGIFPRGNDARRWLRVCVPLVGFVAAYGLFNRSLSGSFLPTTFAAKQVAYQFPMVHFLRHDVWDCFGDHIWLVVLPFALGAVVLEGARLLRMRPGVVRPEVGWMVGLVLAYGLFLPFGHRFERYLVPALPACAIAGLSAVQRIARAARSASRLAWLSDLRPVLPLLLLGGLFLLIEEPVEAARDYAYWCRYHYTRHERTGRWLAVHTPPSAVIATHDIGAIAYYSHRRIVDMAGLILPEVIPHIASPDYTAYLTGLFERTGVTHLAVLRNWLEVTNVDPLFVADPEPEVLEVYRWLPGRTHLVPQELYQVKADAAREAQAGNIDVAIARVRGALAADSLDSHGWTLLGELTAARADTVRAEWAFERALAVYPSNHDARLGLAKLRIQERRLDEARVLLRAILARAPQDSAARALLDETNP
jgi:hypothetical protein